MIRSLHTAASGMYVQELLLDNTANNLANVQTNGYKKNRLNFQDLYYDKIRTSGAMSQDNPNPNIVEIGYGATVVNSSRFHQQGNLNETSNATDVAIVGDGFFQVSLPDGSTGYTRDGALGLSAEGTLVTSSGYLLDPQVVIPAETVSLVIAKDGSVYGYMPQETEPQLLGQITIAKFINPSGLSSMGENIFTASATSGEPIVSVPGENGTGYIKQGFLEGSNVSAVEEMINLMTSQRAYEIGSKAIKAADSILGTVADLKR